MTDTPSLDPSRFPALRAAARKPQTFDNAVLMVRTGIEAGAIRNVDLKSAKETISSAVYDGWKIAVSEPYFYSGRYQDQPSGVYEFYSSFLVMGLHDMLATSRKLAKTNLSGEAIEAMRTFVAEALPLAEAVACLKDKVIKGRAPSLGPSKPINPNKVVKTCHCCFRAIAVTQGTMAHHGYQRPGMGWQTPSCPGIRFRPLEVSNEGLVWLIKATENRLADLRQSLDATDTITSLPYRLTSQKTIQIDPTDTRWSRALMIYKSNLENDIRFIDGDLASLRKRLAEWKPEA